MKFFMMLALLSTSVLAAPATTKKPQASNVKTEEVVKKENKTKEMNALDKKTEDCDEKAKKPVEITPEAISLSGTAGCSLDDAHP